MVVESWLVYSDAACSVNLEYANKELGTSNSNGPLSASYSMRTLSRIKVAWWGCLIGILLYTSVPLAITVFSSGQLSNSSDGSAFTAFLAALLGSLLAVSLPFTLLGRRYVLQRQGVRGAVLSTALLRLGLVEAIMVFGVAIYMITGSLDLFLPFPLISILGLLLLKGEEKFYVELLETVQVQPNS